MTSEAAELARERIQEFGDEHPEALRLARYASLAVRVDAALLRALRTELLPGSDAGIEADLWFSELTESVSSQGFVLDGDVAALLREELAAERVNNEQRALADAARITRTAHHHWPESLRLEERATALALRTPPAAGVPLPPEDDLETLLRGLLKAMTESPSRGTEVSRWAQRALPRLPKAARETEAALLLALGAAERLGTSIRFAEDDRPGRLPDAAGWVLPAASFSRFTRIGLRRFDTGLEFVKPDAASSHLTLPDTTPLFLEISWTVGAHRHVETISVWPGRTVPVPAAARDMAFRSLAGEEFEFEKVEGEAEDVRDEAARASDDLIERTTVLVTFERQPGDATPSCGFFVAPDTVLAFASDSKAARVGASCTVMTHAQRVTGRVTARQHALASVLISISEPLEQPVALSRRFHGPDGVGPFVGSRWHSWSHTPFRAPMEGIVIPSEEGSSDGLMRLEATSPGLPLRGAPVVIDGNLAGQVVEVAPPAIRARPMELLDRFINDNLRQREDRPQPLVFVSYAPEDGYGKGIEMDDPYVDRVTGALRGAHLNPVIDTTISDDDELFRNVNGSDGAVVLLTPVSHAAAISRLELLLLAYRRWAQPDFPIAAFQFRRSGSPPGAPGVLAGVDVVDLDRASDADLDERARRTFARLGRMPDDERALEVIRERLVELAQMNLAASPSAKSDHPDDRSSAFALSVIEHGIASQPQLPFLGPAENREVIETAATLSFPASAYEPLRAIADGANAPRAFSLNAMPLEVARAVIRRAWLGRTPPASVVFRDQSPPKPEDVRARVCDEIAKALPCSIADARLLVDRADATILVILMTRPIPSPSYVEQLLKLLPSAVFLFLLGSEGENPYPDIVVELTVPTGADMEFFKRYKELMQSWVPREADHAKASTPPPTTSKKAARPQPVKASDKGQTVVICSASVSAAMVTRIEHAFAAAAVPVWLDKSDTTIGVPWSRELRDAIHSSRAVVLVWSQAAARSRWILLEILTAFHLDRFILPCVTDAAPLPEFLKQTVHLDMRRGGDEGVRSLVRAYAEAPVNRNPPSPPVPPPSGELRRVVEGIEHLLQGVNELLAEGDRTAAVAAHGRLELDMLAAEKRWPSEFSIRALAGFHRKNAYVLKHVDAIEAGQPPNDKLLDEAERRFLDAALIDPQDVSVLSGLASILMFKRELDAAGFFNMRALELSKLQSDASYETEHNRQVSEAMRWPAAPRVPKAPRSTRQPSVVKGTRKIAPKKK